MGIVASASAAAQPPSFVLAPSPSHGRRGFGCALALESRRGEDGAGRYIWAALRNAPGQCQRGRLAKGRREATPIRLLALAEFAHRLVCHNQRGLGALLQGWPTPANSGT
eukprot:scaffold3917_cov377-Prasinococcus_capsulatus_cf.AAC.10